MVSTATTSNDVSCLEISLQDKSVKNIFFSSKKIFDRVKLVESKSVIKKNHIRSIKIQTHHLGLKIALGAQ